MLIEELKLSNFLSFGPHAEPIKLAKLNLIIGPNGSGKSNFLEAIDLLRSAPNKLITPILEGGGVSDWLWKGEKSSPTASIEAVLPNPMKPPLLRYVFSFTEVIQRFQIVDERIENSQPDFGKDTPHFYYRLENGRPVLNVRGKKRSLQREDIDIERSILAQRRDPDQYPEITYLADILPKIRLYRDWVFGRNAPARKPQNVAVANDMLEDDASNLGLVLNRLAGFPEVKARIVEELQSLYGGIDDFYVQLEGGTVQVFLFEGRKKIPATRLSDGTLRYLCLLTILCHPNPPPLVCIEEPELGMHPDLLPSLAGLLRQFSERSQLIVTTHSDVLVDAMSDMPEAVMVCEKEEGATNLRRLSRDELAPWLEKYRLGELWSRGDIGGNRW